MNKWEISQNFRRAMRLNDPRTLSECRELYRLVLSGARFGLYSGYSP